MTARRLDGGYITIQPDGRERLFDRTWRSLGTLRELAELKINVNILGFDQLGDPVLEVEDVKGVRVYAVRCYQDQSTEPTGAVTQLNDKEIEDHEASWLAIYAMFPRRGMSRRSIP